MDTVETVEMDVYPPLLPPIAVGPLQITPDFITRSYTSGKTVTVLDKIPNFGGYPTMSPVKSGDWSDPDTWTPPGRARGTRVSSLTAPEPDPIETGDCCE